MSSTTIGGVRVAGISTCTPPRMVENLDLGRNFGEDEVRKVVAMAGVKRRPVADANTTATDLSFEAAALLLDRLGWSRDSITGLVLVTQSPDYILPSSSCMAHRWLGLSTNCAAFDINMGCSSYPYGLYVAAAMLRAGGHQRILMLNGDTASRFASPDDHTTMLLFSDAGSATALEVTDGGEPAHFVLNTDGSGSDALIVRGGAYRDPHPANPRDCFVHMDGAAVFEFTIKRVPPLIRETLALAGLGVQDVGCYAFHQSNRFIMKHLAKKCGLPDDRVPIIIEDHGNAGGCSVALTVTRSLAGRIQSPTRVMMLGYGVGLSWGSALATLDQQTVLMHSAYTGTIAHAS